MKAPRKITAALTGLALTFQAPRLISKPSKTPAPQTRSPEPIKQSMKSEIISINAPAGTRKRLASIKVACGLSSEDIFKMGLRYVFLKVEHEKKAAMLAQVPAVEPSRIILPD